MHRRSGTVNGASTYLTIRGRRLSCTTRAPWRSVIRALGQRATAAR